MARFYCRDEELRKLNNEYEIGSQLQTIHKEYSYIQCFHVRLEKDNFL